MSAHLICISSASGVPLFSRKKGNCDALSFALTGSLNGIHMFGKSLNLELLNTLTEDYTVVWKEFNESIIIIGIASGCSLEVLTKVLHSTYNAIVLIVGLNELKSQRNTERIKRELRICFPVFDRLLDSLDCGDSTNKHSSDIIGFIETILCTENHLLQIVLDTFTECVDSMYSCLLIHGNICVATESWWSLHPEEIRLLSLLASADNSENSKDIPVFLPYKSASVPFRFVVCTLVKNVQICCLCGPTPVLNDIEHSVTQCFKNSTDILNGALQNFPRNFPGSLLIDGGILGLLLINIPQRKYMISKNPHQNTINKKSASSSHRLDIMRTFFYQAVLENFIHDETDVINPESRVNKDKLGIDDFNEATETYWCSEYHKCHALKISKNILCVLYNSSVPTQCMRLITQKTYKVLLGDNKQICW